MKRHMGLDWARAVGMLAVVLIHASSTFALRWSRFTLWGVTPALFLNQAARFAVPLFFLLSGLGLGLGQKKFRLPDFWLGRLRRVGLPYLLWTLFYFLRNQGGMAAFRDLAALGRALLWGSADSHLWFMAVLLQLYLLYPLLRLCMERLEGPTLTVSFLLSLFCTLVICLPLPLTGWWRPQLWRLFPTWLFYFVLGTAVTPERLEKLTAFAERRALPLALLTLASALAYTCDAGKSGNLDSIKPQLFLYSPLCFLAILASWKWVGGIRGVGAISAFLARHSMTLYFSHIFFLGLLRRSAFFQRNAGTMLLMGLLVAALSALAALLPEGAERWAKRTSNRAP